MPFDSIYFNGIDILAQKKCSYLYYKGRSLKVILIILQVTIILHQALDIQTWLVKVQNDKAYEA